MFRKKKPEAAEFRSTVSYSMADMNIYDLLDKRIGALEPKPFVPWNPSLPTGRALKPTECKNWRGENERLKRYVSRSAGEPPDAYRLLQSDLKSALRERDEARLELDFSRQTAQAWRIDSDASLNKLAAAVAENTVLRDLLNWPHRA